MRRAAPLLVAVGIAALLVSYVGYTRRVVVELRREGDRTARMFARVYSALSDTTPDASMSALLDLSRSIGAMGVPLVVTDDAGKVTASDNLPFDATREPARLGEFIAALDRENPPVVVAVPGLDGRASGTATVHYGHTPLLRWLRIIPAVQAVVLALIIVAGITSLRVRGRADREKLWAGMARESAHQLGTPISSLSGWIELLGDDPSAAATALAHMRGDLERLERVAHRFERIGRPPKREPVNVAELAGRAADYFRARVPTLAHTVLIRFEPRGAPPVIQGDPVLLEWALEALIKNAIDALAGRGGTVTVQVERGAASGARIRVADDGPGIPREVRRQVFKPGFSTKTGGWGIGLSLARRIVEQNHGGQLTLVPDAEPGATFEIILR